MKEILRTIKPYIKGLPIIIGVTLLCVLLSNKYLNYTTPIYESSSKIRLADVNQGVPNSGLFDDLDVFASKNKVAAEIEVIKSFALCEKVAKKLSLDIEIYRVGQLKSVELFENSPILIKCIEMEEDYFDKSFDLQINDDFTFKLRDYNGKKIEGKLGDTLLIQNSSFLIELNEVSIAQNPNLQIEDNYQFRINSTQKIYSRFQKNLDVMAVDKEVEVVRITYKDANPMKASKIANVLAETYIQDYIEFKFKAAEMTVDFLDEQIRNVSNSVVKYENKIKSYKQSNDITNIRQETETDLRKIAQLRVLQTNLKMRYESIVELEKYIQNGKEDFLALAPNFEAFTDLLSTELIKKIKELQAEKKDLLIEFLPNHEEVISVDNKIKDISSYLIESISNTRKNLETQYNKLLIDIENAEVALLPVPENNKILASLERDLNIYQESYRFLNEKRIEAQIQKAAKISLHRIITPAQSAKEPISPNSLIIKIVSLLLGFILGIVLVFLFDQLFGTVDTKEEIEELSTIPVATVTPLLYEPNAIINHYLKHINQLEVKGILNEKFVVNFNAFQKKSGASFNAYHFAENLARQERKVLLIDLGENGELMNSLSSNVKVQHFSEKELSSFSKSKLKKKIDAYKSKYDFVLIKNQLVNDQFASLFMSLADVNFIMLDTQNSNRRRIEDSNLIKLEYKLDKVYFIINRYAATRNFTKMVFWNLYQILKNSINPKNEISTQNI